MVDAVKRKNCSFVSGFVASALSGAAVNGTYNYLYQRNILKNAPAIKDSFMSSMSAAAAAKNLEQVDYYRDGIKSLDDFVKNGLDKKSIVKTAGKGALILGAAYVIYTAALAITNKLFAKKPKVALIEVSVPDKE